MAMPKFLDVKQVYDELGIVPQDLGCIMLNTEPLKISDIIDEQNLYYAQDQVAHRYVNGIVSEKVPHITLLWGLMQSGEDWKPQVDKVLEDWNIDTVKVAQVTYFESPYEDEQYYCLIAELELTPELVEGNSRLRLLPHIDTFPDYRAHITLAYIQKDEQIRDDLMYALNNRFLGKNVNITGLNYGD
jgi:hypothetical protein